MSLFQQPSAGGDQVKVNEIIGALVLVHVREYREGIVTSFGPSDAVAADVHVLDGAKAGESFENTLIFQKALIGALRSAAGGQPVLGRIGQGTAKPGQSPPYILQPYTEQDAALATAWINSRPQQFQPPATTPTGNGHPAAAPVAPVAQPAPAVDYSALPPEVQELLKQSGAMPR
jgi:hypothetical protein